MFINKVDWYGMDWYLLIYKPIRIYQNMQPQGAGQIKTLLNRKFFGEPPLRRAKRVFAKMVGKPDLN